MKNKIPTVGDIIYVDSDIYLSHGEDDVRGGKTTVHSVRKDGDTLWIVVEPFLDTSYTWDYLGPIQKELEIKFGNSWAKSTPDYRPEFNAE